MYRRSELAEAFLQGGVFASECLKGMAGRMAFRGFSDFGGDLLIGGQERSQVVATVGFGDQLEQDFADKRDAGCMYKLG